MSLTPHLLDVDNINMSLIVAMCYYETHLQACYKNKDKQTIDSNILCIAQILKDDRFTNFTHDPQHT
jgi:hypothetical protein